MCRGLAHALPLRLESNNQAVLSITPSFKRQDGRYIGLAEKVVRDGREILTLNWEQFQPSGYPQFSKSDPGKCTNFETPSAKTLHPLVIKISETLINERFQFYMANATLRYQQALHIQTVIFLFAFHKILDTGAVISESFINPIPIATVNIEMD